MAKGKARRWRPYAVAVVLTVAALLLRTGLAPWVGNSPLLLIFVIPIVISAYLGGLGPGLFATALVGLVTDYFVLPPIHSFGFQAPVDFAQWLFMLLEGVLISVLFAELERWRRGRTDDVLENKHLATERKVRLGFAVALAFLGTIGIVSYLSVVRLNANSQAVAHSHRVMANIDALESAAIETESAQRAYVISGEETFAADYTRAMGRVRGLVQQLRDAVKPEPAQLARVDPLAEAVHARLRHSSIIIELRRTGGMEAVQRRFAQSANRPGVFLQAHVRALAHEMKSAEIVLLNVREEEARRSTMLAQAVIIGGSALALAFVGFAILAIRRDFAGRARAELELRESKEQLEARVAERTKALAQANETLLKSERRFRALIENGSDSIALIGADRAFLYLSPAVTRVEGFTPEELVGRLAIENTHPDDLPLLNRDFKELLVSPGKTFSAVWRRRHKDGHWVWLEGVARNMLDDPAVGAIITNYRDITDRVKNEARLGEQLQRLALLSRITHAIGERQDLRSIFQVVVARLEEELSVDFCCVCLYDIAGNSVTVTYVGAHSEPVARGLELTENSVVPIDENGLARCVRGHLVYEPDIAGTPFPFPQRLASAGLGAMVIAPLLVESRVFGVLVCARRAAHGFSSGECEFLRQASEHTALAAHQAQLYGALQQAYNDLRQTQQQVMQQERLRALGQMASGIAHDINNAISPVALYTEALLEREQLSPRARQQLEIIQRAVDDVAQTVARMGEFYRLREPQSALVPVALNKLVNQVVDLTHARWSDMAQQRGAAVDVRLELADGLSPIAAVESQIRDALVNLVFNAVDAMPQGGLLIVRSRDGVDGRVLLEVVDAGIGMDEDTKRRCLEPFFTTKGTRGTGLGLAMVYGVAQRHGATLDIESEPGKGTLVRLGFAIALAEPAVGGGSLNPPVGPMRILIVDDDPLLLKSLRDALESDGHQISAAGGGQAGIDAFMKAHAAGTPFPVVITDLGMPHVDGRKVAASIKSLAPQTLVMMLTGWGRRLVAEGDVPPGVDQILGKPPKLVELRAALANHFASAESRR